MYSLCLDSILTPSRCNHSIAFQSNYFNLPVITDGRDNMLHIENNYPNANNRHARSEHVYSTC